MTRAKRGEKIRDMLLQKSIIPLRNKDKGRQVASLWCPLSCFTSFSDCDVARRSLSIPQPTRDVVEEVEVLSLSRQGSLSRLIDASYISGFSAIRYINPQATRSSAEPSGGLEHSRFVGFTSLLGPGVTTPCASLGHEGPSGHPRLKNKRFLSLGRGTETSSAELFILKESFKSIRGFDMFNG